MALPKGVQVVRKRLQDGTDAIYYYYRPTRRKLPDPTSPAFEAALAEATVASEPLARDSFAGLLAEYRRSPNFRNLTVRTRNAYDRVFSKLRDLGIDPLRVVDIKRGTILAWRDAIALRHPQAANKLVWVMSAVMTFAVDREWREHNPCAGIKAIKGGHYKRWPEEAIAYAQSRLPVPLRRGVVLALYTGQREGDCLAMRWSQYDGTAIQAITQEKTGATLWIPVHKALKRELDAWERDGETILVSSKGSAWPQRSFAVRFHNELTKHPPLAGLVFHGLRKAAAARLAEAGCSTKEIAAITGHATLAMVELYTKEAEQKRLARQAMGKLEVVHDRDG